MKHVYRRMLRGMKVREESAAHLDNGWSLYILECRDGSLYTGVTVDLDRRLREHQEGKASRYTRTRRPVSLVYREECGSRSLALTRECAVKSLARREKQQLITGGNHGKKTKAQGSAGKGSGQRQVAAGDRRGAQKSRRPRP